MIQEFVQAWEERKGDVRAQFAKKPPEGYNEIVKAVVGVLGADARGAIPFVDRITEIGYDGYQGTLLYVIAEDGYSPHRYWCVTVTYGSCSGCDTLEAIGLSNHETPNETQLDDLMTLALHIVQNIRALEVE